MNRRSKPSRRRPSAHAHRPGQPLRRRVRRALPARGRIAATLLTAVLVGGLLALIHGPWLRVSTVAWAGDRYTPATQLQRALAPLDGAALLTVDAAAVAARLQRLPAISRATVETLLPDTVRVHIVEKVATIVWQTSAVRLLGSADGTLIGQVALEADLPADIAALPLVDDRRVASRDLIVGDRIDAAALAAALLLSEVQPAALGSEAIDLEVRLTDADGFLLVSREPAWEADFGFYPDADDGASGALAERVEAQVTAVRTLFAFEGEGTVSWVDARDPRRVYWRP
ncbi:MAG TPA: FtsQ-type POTRA domain-containing protein [Candidatus Limnocylindria bacterium]|nr:FtsQ-type POTRA domain-containing protein [Candidatus Limnocylindria bacterium]